MYEHLEIESHGPVVVVRLARPERLNALSLALVDELHHALAQIAADLAVRVVILTGAGRGFCAGTDLTEGPDSWPGDLGVVQARYRLQRHVAALVLRLRDMPQPVIAAVHGPASGGGLSLAAACDLRIADSTARFNAAFIKIGSSGGDLGSSWLLPRIVGPAAAAELLYTGRFVDADEALRLGLVSRVTAPGTDVDAAMELAAEVAANPPLGVRMTKELLNVSLDAPSLRHVLELENRTQILCSLTEDFTEGITAFEQRRPPRFTDR